MRFLAFLFFLLFGVFFFSGRWYYTCIVRENCSPQPKKVSYAQRSNTLNLMIGDNTLLRGFDQFQFNRGNDLPNLNANNAALIDTLVNLMANNPETFLVVKGYFTEGEANITKGYFNNLGLARANSVRELLIEKGMNVNRVALDFLKTENRNTLEAPIEFEIFRKKDKVIPLYTFEDMTFPGINFDRENKTFQLTAALSKYFSDLKKQMEGNQNQKLIVTAHTDQIGKTEENLKKGKLRAESIKAYLQKEFGISDSRILIDSKGEAEPIAPNNSNWNRAKNRRINFLLQ